MPALACLGLTPEEERTAAGDYFDRFEWEPVMLDPNQAAGEFLEAL